MELARKAPAPAPPPASVPLLRVPPRPPAQAKAPRASTATSFPPSSSLVPAQQRVLDTLALMERLGVDRSREAFGAWYGKHPRNKAVVNNVGALRSAGLLQADAYELTDAGRARANYIDPPTQEEARELIMRGLKPAQRRILELALEHPGLDRDAFGELLGKHPRNKAVVNNIGALRTRGLLSEDWPLKPTRVLYLNGAN
jgi:hypothetical protein